MQPRGAGDRTVRKGPWTAAEDEVLLQHVREHGPREWSSIRSKGLLPRTGKSCRLRWVNQLRPNLKTGCKFSPEEERVVVNLQAQFGNRWAKIATYLPGRTDNDVKNFWSTRQKRLARILRAPLPRRRSGKHNNGNASSAPSHELPTSKFQGSMHGHDTLPRDDAPHWPKQPRTMHGEPVLRCTVSWTIRLPSSSSWTPPQNAAHTTPFRRLICPSATPATRLRWSILRCLSMWHLPRAIPGILEALGRDKIGGPLF